MFGVGNPMNDRRDPSVPPRIGRERAMKMLRSEIYEIKRREEEERKAQIEGAKKRIEWGSQVRNYVFQPYTLVKDLRTGE